MALDAKQARYAERFFPGLIAKIKSVGAGTFDDRIADLYPLGRGIGKVGLHLRYVLEQDACVISIDITLRLADGQPPFEIKDPNDLTCVDLSKWVRIHYNMKYKTPTIDRVFACDLEKGVHHVHIPPYRGHTLTRDVIPDVMNIDPSRFVDMVLSYRATGIIPISRKP